MASWPHLLVTKHRNHQH